MYNSLGGYEDKANKMQFKLYEIPGRAVQKGCMHACSFAEEKTDKCNICEVWKRIIKITKQAF